MVVVRWSILDGRTVPDKIIRSVDACVKKPLLPWRGKREFLHTHQSFILKNLKF